MALPWALQIAATGVVRRAAMGMSCFFEVGAPDRNVTEHASIDSTPLERLHPARRIRLPAVCKCEPKPAI